MPTTPLLILLLGAGPAVADDGASPVPTAPEADPAAELRAAREAYVLGDREVARDRFVALVQRARVRGDVPAEVRARALVYLGEIQMTSGDRRAADASFRLALAAVPDLRLSPVEHPESVIGAFEVVRSALLAEAERPPERRPPLPWWGYAPFGVSQFKQGKPVRGALYATLQAGLAAASVAAWLVVDDAVAHVPTNPTHAEEADAIAAREHAILVRNAFSYVTAGAFYATWAASVIDGGISWRRGHVVPTGVAVVPQRGGAEVQVSFRF
jgi:hypothetical protein